MKVYVILHGDNKVYLNRFFETKEKAEKARQDLIKDAEENKDKADSVILNFFSKLFGIQKYYKYYDTELYIGTVSIIERDGFTYKIIGWDKERDSVKVELDSYKPEITGKSNYRAEAINDTSSGN